MTGTSDGTEQITTLFTNLTSIGLTVGVVVATFWLMWGGYMYMSAAGSPHQMERGKSAMFQALAGLAVVLMCKIIAGIVQSAVGGGS